jgi:hypothetical protein
MTAIVDFKSETIGPVVIQIGLVASVFIRAR